MEKKYSLAPWKLDSLIVSEVAPKDGEAFLSKSGYLRTVDGNPFCSFLACKPSGGWLDNFEELEANARLIASAPELLESLQWTAAALQSLCQANIISEDDEITTEEGPKKIGDLLTAADHVLGKALNEGGNK